jgi:hypothetical protein
MADDAYASAADEDVRSRRRDAEGTLTAGEAAAAAVLAFDWLPPMWKFDSLTRFHSLTMNAENERRIAF